MKRCPKCSRTYEDDSLNFCLTDGEALLTEAASVSSKTTAIYSQPKKSTRRTFPLFVIGILIIILSAGGYFYFIGGKSTLSKGETNQNNINANTQPFSVAQPSSSITPTTGATANTLQTQPSPDEAPSASPEVPVATPSAVPAVTPAQSGQSTKSKIESQFFTFDLKQCRLSGASVACDLLITNNDRDRRLTIRSSSTIFDQEGNQYRAGKMQLANKEDGYAVSSYMISGVATKARVTFDAISPAATKLTLLHLDFSAESSPDFNIEYRNVSLK